MSTHACDPARHDHACIISTSEVSVFRVCLKTTEACYLQGMLIQSSSSKGKPI